MSNSTTKRAVSIVRVSQVNGREGDSFVSPTQQRERIASACLAHGLLLVDEHEELDVSATHPLTRRPGLRAAVAMVEQGQADVIVVAYFDRLVRNLRVQAEVVERVELAGGSILAVDFGEVSASTAGNWLSSTLIGAVAEYYGRLAKERTTDSRRGAIARGIPVTGRILPGYRKCPTTRRLIVDESEAAIVRGAFELRADGGSWHDVRHYLIANGITRTTGGALTLIRSRTVLGELSHGEHVNLNAHPPIVSQALFDRAQRATEAFAAPTGPRSDMLLAKLGGLLRCGTCGGHMSAATLQVKSGKKYRTYRCQGHGQECSRRVAIAAALLESAVVDRVRELLANQSATVSASADLASARAAAAVADLALGRAIEVLADLGDVAAAKRKLADLKSAALAAQLLVDELERAASVTVTVNAAGDWSVLTLDERRALIGAVLKRVVVNPAPSRGASAAGRITIEARSE